MPALEDYFSDFDAPVTVVTAAGGRELSGCLVGFATQCSIHPPRFLVCLSVVNHTFSVAAMAGSLGVHILGASQFETAALFGETTGEEVDKFAEITWRRGRTGAPLLRDCAAWLEGTILERIDLGDHMGYLLEPVDAGVGQAPGVLMRSAVASFAAGHPADEVQ